MDDIDEDVLKQLPEEIRQEIEAERSKRQIKPKEAPPNPPPPPVNEIGQQDLSFSQFDASILAQLPENIVEELKQQYSKK